MLPSRHGGPLPLALLLLISVCARAQDVPPAYLQQFTEAFPAVAEPMPLQDYAAAARFDERHLAAGWEARLEGLNNDSGNIAWGTSYFMMALNQMFRATANPAYLEANRKVISAVVAATDASRNLALADGRVVAAWGSEKYSGGQRAVHAVHTGIIAAPMLEYCALTKDDDSEILKAGLAALAVHENQWRDGPGKKEGHYAGIGAEAGFEGKPLPANWQSAMGWAYWNAWEAGGDPAHRDRALRLGRYLKARLTRAPDGAYYWPYTLPELPVEGEGPRESVNGEDTSHAMLSMALPFALGKAGKVFEKEDMHRLAQTVLNGIAPDDSGVLRTQVTGATELDPARYLGFPSRWLVLAELEPAVADRILAFYRNHRATPAPLEHADLLAYTGRH